MNNNHFGTNNGIHESAIISMNYISTELRALKNLFSILIVLFCGYVVVKLKLIKRIKIKFAPNSIENSVLYRHNLENVQYEFNPEIN